MLLSKENKYFDYNLVENEVPDSKNQIGRGRNDIHSGYDESL